MEIVNCISECMQETNFFNDQKKLDTMYYLMQGLTYKEIAEKIDEKVLYVQKVVYFLKRNKLFVLHWGRWTPNVYKIGMKKSIAFLNWEDRDLPVKKDGNYNYATYVNHVRAGETKVLVIYTYPTDDESKIVGERGEPITPFYYTNTRFTIPFFKKIDLVKEFFNEFDSVKNDSKILAGTPSFEEKSYNDPMTVYICRYCELLPELTPGILREYLKQDFKDNKEIKTSYENIRSKLEWMKSEGIIFPRNTLDLRGLSYQSALIRIKNKEIYRIMGTFNRFNMLTRLALTCNLDVFYLYLQYPFHQFSEVMEILDELDTADKGSSDQVYSRVFIETKHIMQDTIYYKWSLERKGDSL